ncbi:hypothetical protein QYG89_02770 [Bacillus sp. B190/17]|uniref:Uncharacterized protein n=1 Tax=Bacillus lumedeiriae TaxID=3058829 RepID=A0ABW8I5C0_9BACI
MARETRSIHSGDSSPHFDGKHEGVISDPQGTAQLGIRIDLKQSESPYQITKLKKDPEMEKFQHFFDGEKYE